MSLTQKTSVDVNYSDLPLQVSSRPTTPTLEHMHTWNIFLHAQQVSLSAGCSAFQHEVEEASSRGTDESFHFKFYVTWQKGLK